MKHYLFEEKDSEKEKRVVEELKSTGEKLDIYISDVVEGEFFIDSFYSDHMLRQLEELLKDEEYEYESGIFTIKNCREDVYEDKIREIFEDGGIDMEVYEKKGEDIHFGEGQKIKERIKEFIDETNKKVYLLGYSVKEEGRGIYSVALKKA